MEKDLRIKIKIDKDTGSLKIIRNEFDSIDGAIKRSERTINNFTSRIKQMGHAAIGLYAIDLGFKSITSSIDKTIKTMDRYSNVVGRLKLVTNSTQELVDTQNRLLDIANSTRVRLTSTVDTYSRLARSLRTLNINSNEMLKVTKSINESLIISGASAMSADAALVQLGQGLASGVLRGQELMSVMEQTPRLAQAIADGMGVTIGELRKLGEQGELTSKRVFDALLSQSSKISSEFEKMPKTVSSSLISVDNSLTDFAGKLNQTLGITKNISKTLLDVSSYIKTNEDALVSYVEKIGLLSGSVLGTIAVYKGLNSAVKLYSSLTKTAKIETNMFGQVIAKNSIKTAALATATRGLNFALKAIPFLAIAGTIYEVADAFLTSKRNSDLLNESISTMGENFKKLTKNQLEYEKVLLDDKIMDAIRDNAEAYVAVEHKGFFESEEDHKKELARLDETKQKLKQLYDLRDKLNYELYSRGVKNIISLKDISVPMEKSVTKTVTANMKTWERYYKTINDMQKAWLVSQTRSKAYDDILKLHLDSNAAKRYIDSLKDSYIGKIKEAKVPISKAFESWKGLREISKDDEKWVKEYLKKSEDVYLEYYTKIGDWTKAWAIKERELKKKYAYLNPDELKKLVNIEKREYFEKLNKEAEKSVKERIQKEKEAYEKWLKEYGTLTDGMQKELNDYIKSMPTEYEQGIELMKSATSSLNDAWTDFFDSQSDAFLDFGDLGKKIISDLEKQLIDIQIVKPLTSASSSLLSSGFSVGVDLLDSFFDGWAAGGYTYKDTSDKTPVGVVHANEYVIPAWMVKKHPSLVAGLEAERRGLKGFWSGGSATDDSTSSGFGGIGNGDSLGGIGNALGRDNDDKTTINNINTTNIVTKVDTAKNNINDFTNPNNYSGLPTETVINLGPNSGWTISPEGVYNEKLGKYEYTEATTKAWEEAVKGGLLGGLKGGLSGLFLGAAGGYYKGSKEETTKTGYVDDMLDKFGDINVKNTINTLEGLDGLFEDNGDYISYAEGVTAKQIEDATKKLQIAYKNDTIDALDDIWDSFLGATPKLKDNIDKNWQNLFESYLEQGNNALLKTALDGSVFDTPDFYSAWDEYAKGLNESVEDALKNSLTDLTNTKRDFNSWFYDYSGDTLGGLKYKADYLKEDLEKLEDAYGQAGLTLDNFNDRMTESLLKDFTPENIENWEKLEDATKAYFDAQKEYVDEFNKEKEEQLQALYDASADKIKSYDTALTDVTNAINNYIPNDIKLSDIDISNVSLDNYKSIIDDINKAYENELDSINEYFDNQKSLAEDSYNAQKEYLEQQKDIVNNNQDIVDSLKDISDSINSDIISKTYSVDMLKSLTYSSLNNVNTALQSGSDASVYMDSLDNYYSLYLDKLKDSAVNNADYMYQALMLKNSIDKVATNNTQEATLSDIDDALANLEDTYKLKTDSLELANTESINDLKNRTVGMLDALYNSLGELRNTEVSYLESLTPLFSSYLGENSAIVNAIKALQKTEPIKAMPSPIKTYSDTTISTHHSHTFKPRPNTNSSTITGFVSAPSAIYMAEGGIVNEPTLAMIGEAGYSEAVIPLKNPNDPLSLDELKQELKLLRAEVRRLTKINEQYQPQIAKNTKPSRWAS